MNTLERLYQEAKLNTLERLYQEAKEEGELDLFFEALSSGRLTVVGLSPEEVERFIAEKTSWVH